MNKFHMFYFLSVKLQPQSTKTVKMRSKTVWRVNIWSFLMHISKKLTFWHSTDGIKSQNKNKHMHNVTYNYQMSKCHLNFDTLLNFQRPFWPYEIGENFLTSPFEHTVLERKFKVIVRRTRDCSAGKRFPSPS